MPTLQEVRTKFPQYNDMSDADLAEALHSKYYSDMPFGEFAGKIGFTREWAGIPGEMAANAGGNAWDIATGLGHAVMNPNETIKGLGSLAAGGIDNLVGMGLDAVGIERGTPSPEQENRRESASQTGRAIADTLGTKEGFKHYIARQPVSAATDIASLLAGGSTLVPKIAGKTAGVPLKEMLRTAPSAKTVSDKTTELFDAIRAKDAKLPMEQFIPARDRLRSFLEGESITAMDAPQATNQANRLFSIGKPLEAPQPTMDMWGNRVIHPVPAESRTVSLNDLESIRRGAGRVERATNLTDTAATDKMVAGKIKEAVDSYYANAADPALKGEIEAAREMGRRKILARQIKEMVRKGEEYRSGAESGIGNQFANYLKSEKGKGSALSPEERKAFRAVARREGVAGAVSTAGSGLGKIALAMLGSTGGPVGVAGAFAGHLAARKFAETMVRKAAKNAEKTVLIGHKAQKAGTQAAKELRMERLVKMLLAAEAAKTASGATP